MGLFTKCCCCCEQRQSTVICTVLVLTYNLYSLVSQIKTSASFQYYKNNGYYSQEVINQINPVTTYISMAVQFIVIFLLVCLLFGIFKKKVSLMKPFEYGFPLYLIYNLGSLIYGFMKLNKISDKLVSDVSQKSGNNLNEDQERTMQILMDSLTTISLIIAVIVLLLYIYYYLTTRSYIKECEKDDAMVKESRDIENAN